MSDCHDTAVGRVVHVAAHGGPASDTFDMVNHEPNILEVATLLHAFDKVNSASRADFRHFKKKHFVGLASLTREFVFLHKWPKTGTT